MTTTVRRIIPRHFLGLFALATAVIMGCAHSGYLTGTGTNTEVGLLTEKLAQARGEVIHNVSYDLTVELEEKSTQYKGAVTTEFELRKVPNQLWLDFRGGTIDRLVINDVKTESFRREGSLVWLPTGKLKKGVNRIFVSYAQSYNTNGVGLHRFQDPADQEIYLYTHFEPYDASRFMPMFDQPDLRATLKLKVRAPRKWHVITATEPERISQEGDAYQFWNFKKTPPIATYLFSLHAGPYKEFKSTYGKTPLRLFIRKSLAQHLPVENWFQWTKQGLKYFEQYFAVPYPFGKYDQIVVPEFNMGAMENVAAITFSERYIKRGAMTYNERLGLASVILHEMAHQWFGNLVTMKWWDDLWLNESFATYMAAKAMYEATEFRDAWVDFNGDKQWALTEDQHVTTHPIAAQVANTNQAFNNFDGITYGKGAAVMKQLEYLIGAKAFQEGLRHYFKVHAYKNTTLRDFIAALQSAALKTQTPMDLLAWSKLWLEQSGVDTVRAETQCEGTGTSATLTAVTLTVTTSPGANFRPQAVDVATLILTPAKTLRVQARQKVMLQQPTQTVTFTGKPACPALVYANFDDHGYLKTPLAPAEVEVLKTSLGKVENPHLRLMLWASLWQMVRDGELPPATYAEIVLQNTRDEKDMKIYDLALQTLGGGRHNAFNNALYFLPQATEAEQAQKRHLITRLEGHLMEILKRHAPNTDKYKSTLAALATVAQSERALNELYLRATQDNLDLDRRWTIAKTLCRNNHPKALEFRAEMLKQDSSSRGENSALACEAARPDVNIKKRLLTQVTDNSANLSGEKQKAILRELLDESREEFTHQLSPLIMAFAKKDLAERDEDFQEDFAEALAPVTCDAQSVENFKKFVKSSDLSDVAAKVFKVSIQERERCVSLRRNAPVN